MDNPLLFHHLQVLREHQIIEELAREMGCTEAEVRPLVAQYFRECEQVLRQPLPPTIKDDYKPCNVTYLKYGGIW
jgi:hypothetical protein